MKRGPFLLDINLLIALTWPNHIHHETAHRWFARHRSAGWVTCPMTECGFVRVSSNPAFIDGAVTPVEALSLLARLVSIPDHRSWNDDLVLSQGALPAMLLAGHRQVTDAYLLGLAVKKRGILATMDKGILGLLSDRKLAGEHLEIVR